MKLGVILTALFGLALGTAIIGYFGFGAVLSSLETFGWRGLAALTAYSLLPILILGTAWFILAEPKTPRRFGVFVWARVMRDAATEHLPFSQFGGFLIGARVAILHGVTPTQAFATTVVDATAELIAQIAFIGFGLGVLAVRLDHNSSQNALMGAGLIGLALCVVGAVAFIALQRRGSGVVAALTERFLPSAAGHASAITAALDELYRRPVHIAAAVITHFCAWLASAAGAWIALRFAGVSLGLNQVLAMECLIFAIRSAAFAAPMAIGVQEAGYALVGPLFGLPPNVGLALSLLKRARDLAIGVPALLIWQTHEARRLITNAPDATSDPNAPSEAP